MNLTDQQIQLIRTMTARPVSGSTTILGIYERDGTVGFDRMSEILGHDRYTMFSDVMSENVEDDRNISVIRHVDRVDAFFIQGMVSRLRFRHQLILVLEGGDHDAAFLSRIAVINPEARP
jgi:hypothetical protein